MYYYHTLGTFALKIRFIALISVIQKCAHLLLLLFSALRKIFISFFLVVCLTWRCNLLSKWMCNFFFCVYISQYLHFILSSFLVYINYITIISCKKNEKNFLTTLFLIKYQSISSVWCSKKNNIYEKNYYFQGWRVFNKRKSRAINYDIGFRLHNARHKFCSLDSLCRSFSWLFLPKISIGRTSFIIYLCV